MKKKIIFVITFFFLKANAVTIHDYEIENFIFKILLITIPDNNSEKNIKFSIILDENPNAFINEKNVIFITTGLLKYIQYPEALIGVLAHEIGHINNYHIQKRKKTLEKLNLIDQLGSLTTLATAILLNNHEILLKSSITNKINIQNYYSAFSREQEREADTFAIERLNDLNISANQLNKFLIFLENESYKKGIDNEEFQFSSHPNYNERLNLISNLSLGNNNEVDQSIKNNFEFIKAKLFGYTDKNIEVLESYLYGNFLKYAKAILLSRKGKLLDSLKLINELIVIYPNNIYFIETKADILYRHNYTKESKVFYKFAFKQDTKNIYIQKRIFEIEYDNIGIDNMTLIDNLFIENKNIIFIFSNDLVFYKKWLKILKMINKKDWIYFVKAKINIINGKNEESLKNLNNVLIITDDKELKKNTKILIKNLND